MVLTLVVTVSSGLPWWLTVKNPLAMQEISVQSQDPVEKRVAAHSSILASRIPWTEEPGRVT